VDSSHYAAVSLGCVQYITYLSKAFTYLCYPTDDGLCVVACVLAVAYAGVVYHWIQYQWFGFHVWDIPDHVRTVDNQVFASKLNMAQQMLYNPILGIVKASIILFLLRLGDRRWFIRYGLIAFFIFK
jgi:hypothetical protein